MQLFISARVTRLGEGAAVHSLPPEETRAQHRVFSEHVDGGYLLASPLFLLPSAGLYYVDSEGNRVCGDLFAVGSGSMYAYGVMDSGLRQDLTVEEACELGRRAIYQATYRDAYSGGQVNLYHVHSEGWTRISQDDVLMLHHRYKDQA